jgi:YgiT-type zinc finger domain-containing protein
MKETMIETKVTYFLEYGGKFYIIEQVPARVCLESGEQFFSPETVEHIQALIKGGKTPTRLMETPVYDYPEMMSGS